MCFSPLTNVDFVSDGVPASSMVLSRGM
ncbi:MAG: hypothetical protein RL219_1712, partial [Actinomycetota bacterium]